MIWPSAQKHIRSAQKVLPVLILLGLKAAVLELSVSSTVEHSVTIGARGAQNLSSVDRNSALWRTRMRRSRICRVSLGPRGPHGALSLAALKPQTLERHGFEQISQPHTTTGRDGERNFFTLERPLVSVVMRWLACSNRSFVPQRA